MSHEPAASAAALPELEPPVVFPGGTGLWTVPKNALWPSTPHANSGRFALPTTHRAGVDSVVTTVAVRVGTWSA